MSEPNPQLVWDAILLTNLFHHFSAEDNIRLMQRFRAALRPGGQMLTLEFVPNEDRVSPPAPASFAMTMLVNTAHRLITATAA